MQYHILRPRQALNKAYLSHKTPKAELERFKRALVALLEGLRLHQTEELARNQLRSFLELIFYDKYSISTQGKANLVIHNGSSTKSHAGVLLEVRRPTGRADMPTPENLNVGAMHELLLYYLRERVEHQNHDLRHLVVTSVHEWFVFDALEFDGLFYRNKHFREGFTNWAAGRKASSSNGFFYRHIAAPYITDLSESITFTHFNLHEYENSLNDRNVEGETALEELYILLSPDYLLKESGTGEHQGENSSPVCYAHLKGLREGFEDQVPE